MRRCSFRRLRGFKTSFQLKGTESIQAASGYFNLANTIDGESLMIHSFKSETKKHI